MRIRILIFRDVDLLDRGGPYEVAARTALQIEYDWDPGGRR
jgi:hypothetical protein